MDVLVELTAADVSNGVVMVTVVVSGTPVAEIKHI